MFRYYFYILSIISDVPIVFFCWGEGGRKFLLFFLIWLLQLHFRGYKRFYRRNALEASDYLKDDCLVMYCKVGVVRNHLECPKLRSISVPPSDMGQGFKDLLESEVGCDVVFQVGNEMFKAHKLILAARSPVFRAQFFGLVGNPNVDKVVVKDIDPFIFKVMLLDHIASFYHNAKEEN